MRLHSPGPSPVEGCEHNTILELIAVLIDVNVVVITWNNKNPVHLPNPNLYLYTNYNWNFWCHVFQVICFS